MKYKTLKIKLRNLDFDTYQNILNKCKVSRNLYNQAGYMIRQYYEINKKYLDYYEINKRMRIETNLEGNINYRLLKAQTSQQILRKLDVNWKLFFKSLKNYKKNPSQYTGSPGVPKCIKKEVLYYNLIYTSQNSSIKNNKIHLEKNVIINLPKSLIDKNIKTIEIIPKEGFLVACFSYEDQEEYKLIRKNKKVMGIDLGVNNLAACVTNLNIRPFLINGKPIKSINQFFNKKRAKKQSILKKRNNRYISKALTKLQDKKDIKVKDYLHKASSKIVTYCVKYKISKVVIGGVTKGMVKIAKKNNKKNNQNFVDLKLGQFLSFIRYKLERHNVEVLIKEESYTSICSFIDKEKVCKHETYLGKRVHRGLFRTASNRLINADINGASNILKKAIPDFGLTKKGIEALFMPYKLDI